MADPETPGGTPLILLADDWAANGDLLRQPRHSLGFRTIVAPDDPAVLEIIRRGGETA